jgi:hypothetical protein
MASLTRWSSLPGVNTRAKRGSSAGSSANSTSERSEDHSYAVYIHGVEVPNHISQADGLDERLLRLVDWNVDLLCNLLRLIASRRLVLGLKGGEMPLDFSRPEGTTTLDEVQEIVLLPGFNAAFNDAVYPEDIDLGEAVVGEVREYVRTIAMMYQRSVLLMHVDSCR